MDIYFASCVPSGGIYHYMMGPGGDLSFREKVTLDRPMYLIRQKDILVALLRAPFPDSNESGLVRYALEPDGSLGRRGRMIGTKGVVAAHMSLFCSSLYAANYLSGSLFREDGILATHCGHGPNPLRQEAPHPHMIAPSPDGLYLIATDLGLDKLFVYDKELHVVSTADAPKGSGPRHFVILDASHIAVINELGCSISLYGYAQGSLCLEETIPLLSCFDDKATGAAIRMQNRVVYASVRGANRVFALSWDGKGLSFMQDVSCGGDSPRDIVIAGERLWCMNELSGTVVRYLLASDGSIGEREGEPLAIPHVLSAVAG